MFLSGPFGLGLEEVLIKVMVRVWVRVRGRGRGRGRDRGRNTVRPVLAASSRSNHETRCQYGA